MPNRSGWASFRVGETSLDGVSFGFPARLHLPFDVKVVYEEPDAPRECEDLETTSRAVSRSAARMLITSIRMLHPVIADRINEEQQARIEILQSQLRVRQ